MVFSIGREYFKMRLFIIIAVSVFIAGITFVGAVKEKEPEKTPEEKKNYIIHAAKVQMTFLHAADWYYDFALTKDGIAENLNTEAKGYAKSFFRNQVSLTRPTNCPADYNELKYHFIYFKSTIKGIKQPTPEQVYVNTYIIYTAFRIALDFRICVVYYSTVFPDVNERNTETNDRIRICGKLFEYMRWFLSIFFEERIKEFEHINRYSDGQTSRWKKDTSASSSIDDRGAYGDESMPNWSRDTASPILETPRMDLRQKASSRTGKNIISGVRRIGKKLASAARTIDKAKDIAQILSTLNLNFVRNYYNDLEQESDDPFVTAKRGSIFRRNCIEVIDQETTHPAEPDSDISESDDESMSDDGDNKHKLPTIFPDDINLIAKNLGAMATVENPRTKTIYYTLWRLVIQFFSRNMLRVWRYFNVVSSGDFFEEVMNGKVKVNNRKNLLYLIPDQNLSLKVWEHLGELETIKNLPTDKTREIFRGIEGSSDNIHRSNVIEIIRRIKEIEGKYYLDKISSDSANTDNVWDLLGEDINKGEPNFYLQKVTSKARGVDYNVVLLKHVPQVIAL